METKIKAAIELLAERVTNTISQDEALKFTQAALNLAHALATIDNLNPKNKDEK